MASAGSKAVKAVHLKLEEKVYKQVFLLLRSGNEKQLKKKQIKKDSKHIDKE